MRIRADIVTPSGVSQKTSLVIDNNGQIAEIIAGTNNSVDFDYGTALVVPGFIDTHVHGGGGADFMHGSAEAVRTASRTHARHGTTSLLATTITADRYKIDAAITSIVQVIEHPEPGESTIKGIHLEGPYICSKRRGAQPESPIRTPDTAELDHWQELSGHRIKQITLAPELDGALTFIRHAVAQGVDVSIGHTDADSAQVDAGIKAGARLGTHLFNAMTPLGHRSPGAVGALLTNDLATCELICDGFHVDPMVVKLAVRAKGAGGIVLITDAMSGTAMPDGDYELGGRTVIVKEGTAKFSDGTFAGSVLTMNKAFGNVVTFTNVSLADASRMASLNAAIVIGLEKSIGSIEVGKLADLSILDPITGDVLATFIAGKLIFQR